MYNFIKTSDINIANELRNAGFKELPREGKLFVFINDSDIYADLDKKSGVVLTNNISI